MRYYNCLVRVHVNWVVLFPYCNSVGRDSSGIHSSVDHASRDSQFCRDGRVGRSIRVGCVCPLGRVGHDSGCVARGCVARGRVVRGRYFGYEILGLFRYEVYLDYVLVVLTGRTDIVEYCLVVKRIQVRMLLLLEYLVSVLQIVSVEKIEKIRF